MAKKEKKAKVKKDVAEGGNKEKKGGGVIFAIVSLLSALLVIVAVLGGFLFFIVKMNAFGVADIYKDQIAKVPLLNLALPKVEPEPSEMTLEELLAKYESTEAEKTKLQGDLDSANSQIEDLSKAKSEFDAQTMVYNEKTAQLQQQIATFEANKKQLEDMKYDLDRIVATGDKAAFATYYEGVSPEVAQEIYAQIIQEKKSDDELKKFRKLFETIDTKTSAQIIETLGPNRIDFITETLAALKKEITAEIISNLSPELAAQVTLRLSGN